MPDIASLIDQIGTLLKYDSSVPLIFSSGLFLFLFLGFAFFYQFLRKTVMLRIIYLICFSLFFYYKTSGWFVLLLVGLSLSDFTIGYFISVIRTKATRKWLLALSLSLNLGLLCYFKYTHFFIDLINGIKPGYLLDFQNVFLPVGISFFTFQSMSYVIDIYRKRIKPVYQWIDYLFYLSFFPQLVAGPIVRARDFIPQIYQSPLIVSREMFGRGVFLIIAGLFKKAVISDYISLNFVDRIFDDPLLYSGFENLMGVYGYALQIYCDFSGYSDMAIGIALLLGFHFNKNFDSPYKSATITEFWRRWHISLSSWLKDYLYISLGGNRQSKWRTYLNLMITMILGGLWHGAALRFILWGAWHGLGLAIHKAVMTWFPSFKAQGMDMPRWRRVIGITITFNFVCASWIMFRANDTQTGLQIISQIFTDFRFKIIPQVVLGYLPIFGLILLGYALHLLPKKAEDWGERIITRTPLVAKALILALLIWSVMLTKSADVQPFIYFQF